MKQTTFEEACKIQKEALNKAIKDLRDYRDIPAIIREALQPTGWTSSELVDEAARRVKERIAQLRKAEENNGYED